MRRVLLGGTNLTVSPLGMGCASLGSRYGAADGLRALEEAFDRGVTWFDVAPAYGAGEAESIIARFLSDKRNRTQLCTKVGLAAPPRGLARRLLTPVARPVISRLKALRGAVRKSGATANVRLPLTPERIEQSITHSLTRLGTDRVEVYALHSPMADDLARDDVLRALEQVVARGQARYVGVAGEVDAGLAGAASGRFAVVQLADDPVTSPLDALRAAGASGIISHSILGVGGAQARITEKLRADPKLFDEVRAQGFGDTPLTAAATLLMARAFASNPDGVVLASMFGNGHLTSNAAAAELAPNTHCRAEQLVSRCLTSQ